MCKYVYWGVRQEERRFWHTTAVINRQQQYIYTILQYSRTQIRLNGRDGRLGALCCCRGGGASIRIIILLLFIRRRRLWFRPTTTTPIPTVQIFQDTKTRQVDVIDAVGVNLDTGVERTGRLGKVDPATTMVVVGCCVLVVIRVSSRSRSSITLPWLFFGQELVNVFNEIKIPGITGVDAIFGIHFNCLLVHFSQGRRRRRGCLVAAHAEKACRRATTISSRHGDGIAENTLARQGRRTGWTVTSIVVVGLLGTVRVLVGFLQLQLKLRGLRHFRHAVE